MSENTDPSSEVSDEETDRQPDPVSSNSDGTDVVSNDPPEQESPDEEIRVGSPFAMDPLPAESRPIEPFYDVGPIRYTAMGSVAASIMVLGFAIAAAWWFPSGGALIAALGCVLSIFGMYSAFRLTSVGLLAVHLMLFVVSYGRSIG